MYTAVLEVCHIQNIIMLTSWLIVCPFVSITGVRPRSETCQVTENIAQYLNYFFGSVLKQNLLILSPNCIPSTSCNDIVCILPHGGHYQYSLLSCQNPPALRLLSVLSNGTVYFQHVTSSSEIFPLPPMPSITLNITFTEITPSTIGLGVSKN